jgi:archaetidylinositol phosphate synthase
MPDRKPRHGLEVACEYVFRPLAHVVARALGPLRVPPPAVVVAGACAGLASAVEIGRHQFLAAALILQLKTVLDNADGQLARLSGRVTAFGRYLDSESDLLVDAALFAALGLRIGPWLALTGFLALTSVLSVNFNLERLYRESRGGRPGPAAGTEGRATALLARVYGLVYAPQDRLVEAFARRRPPAWHDAATVGVVANFGLSSQLAALGVCLALGHPGAYVAVVLACLLALASLLVRRERLARQPLIVTD